MRLRSFTVLVHDPERRLFGQVSIRGIDADSLVSELFPNGPTAWVVFTLKFIVCQRGPAAAYMSKVETWRELPGGEIELTVKRLRSAD